MLTINVAIVTSYNYMFTYLLLFFQLAELVQDDRGVTQTIGVPWSKEVVEVDRLLHRAICAATRALNTTTNNNNNNNNNNTTCPDEVNTG